MTNRKHRLGLIGLCFTAALVLTAFAASSAQAKPEWMVGGANVTSELKVELGVEIEPLGVAQERHLVLLAHFILDIAILCGTAGTKNVVLLAGGVADGEVSFSNCTTSLNGSVSPPCKPLEPIVAKASLLISLHEGVSYTLVEPTPGSVKFTTINFGEECSVGEEFELTGQLWLEDCFKLAETEGLVHLIQAGKAAAEKLGGLFFGANKASLDGSVNIRLFDKGVQKAFSVLAA